MNKNRQTEPGAPSMAETIPLCEPEIGGREWEYLKECLDTNWVSSVGSYVDRFEQEVAAYAGAGYGVATSSGTAAIHIALLVAGVQPDDEVLVSTLSFIAPANAIRYVGAWPVFMDAEPDYWQMDIEKVERFLTRVCQWRNGELRNPSSGRRVRGILPVHILGHPCDMDPLLELARRYDLVVIEDATESLGAQYRGRTLGSLGDVSCFSFNGNKLITTGGGGMLVTDNQEWARRARYLTTQAKDDSIEYVHNEIGYNYRLTNIQAAMGCAQMESLEHHIAAKRRMAATYAESFASVPGISPMREASWAASVPWLYTVSVDRDGYGMSSRELLAHLEDSGIQARPLWQPLHLSQAHRGAHAHECVVAEDITRDALSLPSSVGLSSDDQQRVLESVASAKVPAH